MELKLQFVDLENVHGSMENWLCLMIGQKLDISKGVNLIIRIAEEQIFLL